MLDIKFLKENPQIIKENLKKRFMENKLPLVNSSIELYDKWLELKKQAEELRSKRNKLSLEINDLKKQKKDITNLLQEVKNIPNEIKKIEEQQLDIYEKLQSNLLQLPNLIHKSVPIGKDESENVELRKWGEEKKFSFPLKSHVEIIENLNIGDFDKSSEISGHGFYTLKGDLALLNRALINFGIDFMLKRGYLYIEPPLMLRKKTYEGLVEFKDFKDMIYKLNNEDAYLIATSEHPMIAMYMNEVIEGDKLPIKLTSYSMCFRKEIGSHGIDQKGLYRTHQFNKIEQVIICKLEDSYKYYEELLKNSEEICQELKIPYRVLEICSGNLGILKSKSADIEAWFPRQEKYQEIGSCSNLTDFQARRLNIRSSYKQERRYLHTLNNTALATSRIMVAILENYQQEDGSIKVPEALVPYMEGLEFIKSQ